MSIALIIFIMCFVVLLLIGAPTYLALLVSGLSYCFIGGGINDMMIMQKMFGSLDNFVLLAIPMFMMAGIVMNTGGITDRIFNFCRAMLGHFPGGLAYVNVAASLLFSGMSGSALADVGGLGQVEMKAMADEGYDDDMIIGITAASSTMGPIVPPSIPMVIYGSAASVSVGALFTAGVIPGAIMAIVLCVAIFFVARRKKYPVHKKATFKERLHTLRKTFFALMMPVVIMGGIWSGYFTPTEAALVSIVYVLFVILVVYKEMGVKQIPKVMEETVVGIVPALTIISSSALFGWVLQFERLDKIILKGLLDISHDPKIILLLVNLLLLFFGMILDSTPVILLMVPMLLPLTRQLGINDIHLGVIVVLNLMIGLMTPPIGQSLFMLSSVTKKPFGTVVRHTAPWLIPLFASLAIVTYFPDLILFLPRFFNLVK
ncbi:TRAP transporter large permease [Petroclostridium sp. X23]|uniref:TRAP transporter large permease n=1 Tax=Petroclostridium sp. X23 TaxID=3045146 RepID=UPI0024AD08E8|nr:TRAP transporter large permease [Petroclostridium sp. X23]WHH58546.1 TRAP transporter large permease [Petroclostridium sp. X23]